MSKNYIKDIMLNFRISYDQLKVVKKALRLHNKNNVDRLTLSDFMRKLILLACMEAIGEVTLSTETKIHENL